MAFVHQLRYPAVSHAGPLCPRRQWIARNPHTCEKDASPAVRMRHGFGNVVCAWRWEVGDTATEGWWTIGAHTLLAAGLLWWMTHTGAIRQTPATPAQEPSRIPESIRTRE